MEEKRGGIDWEERREGGKSQRPVGKFEEKG